MPCRSEMIGGVWALSYINSTLAYRTGSATLRKSWLTRQKTRRLAAGRHSKMERKISVGQSRRVFIATKLCWCFVLCFNMVVAMQIQG